MKIFILLVLSLFLLSCEKPGLRTVDTENNSMKVELLFTIKGNEIYRFSDAGHYIYFVIDSNGKPSKTSTPHTVSTGKNTTSTHYDDVNNIENFEER